MFNFKPAWLSKGWVKSALFASRPEEMDEPIISG